MKRIKSLRIIDMILSDSDIYLTIIIVSLFFVLPVVLSFVFKNTLIILGVTLIFVVANMNSRT